VSAPSRDRAAGWAEAPIAATKLRIPERRFGLVPREGLVDILAGGSPRRATLLSAPAGSGKTTLLAQWSASPAESRAFAWLSLDQDDDDPVRFWLGALAAVATIVPEAEEAAAGALRARGELTTLFLPLLVNDLMRRGRPLVLVFDDYHLIRDPEIHESVAWLLERAPAELHVALATRADPPLPLARLRARGELHEVRAAELRFSSEEAGAFLNGGLGLSLSREEVVRLQRRTEGWAAGLQLAGLSLHGHRSPGAFIASFAGDDRHVVDYLGGEVVDGQPPELRAFMLRTSILERMTPTLCDDVTGMTGSAARLEELERRNLFTLPLDASRRWYRYHHLFRQLLMHQLEREDPQLVRELHRRAGAWHRRCGAPAAAIRHALAAGDVDVATELVAGHWNDFFTRGFVATLAGWLDALPPDAVARDPRLWLARAWTALDDGRLDDIGSWLESPPLEPDDPTHAADRERWARLLAALHRFKTGDVAGARRAVDGLAPPATEAEFWHTVANCVRGVTAYWSGDPGGAAPAFATARELASAAGNHTAVVYALGYLALIEARRGAVDAAAAHLDRVTAMTRAERQLDEHFTAAPAHLARATVNAGRAEAGAELARAVALARRGAGRVELAAALAAQAAELRARGELVGAAALEDEARAIRARGAHPAPTAPERDGAARARAAEPRPPAPAAGGEHALTGREVSVLRLLPSELSLREIGGELYLSLNTVKTHVRHLYAKLGVQSREAAVARGRECGLV
jgi:LuxR family maltose regulon positive regulatory protein